MNFKDIQDYIKCYSCNSFLDREFNPEHPPDKSMIMFRCECGKSFLIPCTDSLKDNHFIIHLPILNDNLINYHFDIDTRIQSFQITFLSKEISLLDKNKYYKTNHIPNFIFLPLNEMIKKLEELIVFI